MFQALKPETKKSPTHRSKVKISRNKNNLSFTIGAKDTIALRAALNSHLRFIKAWKNIVKLLDAKNLK